MDKVEIREMRSIYSLSEIRPIAFILFRVNKFIQWH